MNQFKYTYKDKEYCLVNTVIVDGAEVSLYRFISVTKVKDGNKIIITKERDEILVTKKKDKADKIEKVNGKTKWKELKAGT